MIPKKSVFALAKALEGVPVLGTLSGTPAALAGIRYGDVLLSVNGMRTKNVVDYVEAKALRTDGMEVIVFRSGTEKVSELSFSASSSTPPDAAKILAELITLRIGAEEGDDDEPSRGNVS